MTLSWKHEIAAIERRRGISFSAMKSPARVRHIVAARWEAFAVLRARGWSLERIAALFNRDHTTVMYGLERRAARQLEEQQRGQ